MDDVQVTQVTQRTVPLAGISSANQEMSPTTNAVRQDTLSFPFEPLLRMPTWN